MKKGAIGLIFFGIIKKIITYVFKFIYIIIKLLNLQLPVLIGLIGLILYITGAFSTRGGIWQTLFYILLIFSIFFSIIRTIKKILVPNSNKNDKRKNNVQIVNNPPVSQTTVNNQTVNETQTTVNAQVNTQTVNSNQTTVNQNTVIYPIYFTVKQNPNYIMAEYSDRYELYQKTQTGLQKIRTDYKN